MSKESEISIFQEQLAFIESLKQKIEVFESAFGMIHSATEEMSHIEEVVKEIKDKINSMEKKIISLLDALSKNYQFNESKILALEKRIKALEMKDSLVKHAYNSDNIKN